MKRIITLLSITAASIVYSQNFGFQAGFSYPNIAEKNGVDGSAEYKIKIGYNLGTTVGFNLRNYDELEIGAFYQKNHLSSEYTDSSGQPQKLEKDLNMLFIPLSYKYNFDSGIFIKGGPLFTFDLDRRVNYLQSFSGIGFGVAVGKDIIINSGALIRVNAYGNAHTLLSYYDGNRYINDIGLQLGYVFSNVKSL